MSTTDAALRIATVGDNCIDVIGPPVSQRLVGGNAVNVAVQLARLGLRAACFSAVGRDGNGDLVAATLVAKGVDTAWLVRRDRPTARTLIGVDAAGDRHIEAEEFGACDGYAPDAAARTALAGMDHVHIGWLNDGGALRRALAAAGASVSQDIGVNAAPADLGVAGLAIAFASQPGSHAEARALARRLRDDGARAVVVTRGAGGSSAFFPGEEAEQPALPIVPRDTTGAGDAFIAGFLAAHLAGATLADAMARAAALAAETCLHPGGFPQQPAPADG